MVYHDLELLHRAQSFIRSIAQDPKRWQSYKSKNGRPHFLRSEIPGIPEHRLPMPNETVAKYVSGGSGGEIRGKIDGEHGGAGQSSTLA